MYRSISLPYFSCRRARSLRELGTPFHWTAWSPGLHGCRNSVEANSVCLENISTTNRTSRSLIWHALNTRFTEPCMSARHQCEASTGRHEAHLAAVVRGWCSCRRCWFRRRWSRRCCSVWLASSSSSLLLLLLSSRGCKGLRMSADRTADHTQKL